MPYNPQRQTVINSRERKASSNNLRDRLPLNNTLLPVVSAHTIIVVAEIRALHVPQKVFIVRNDDELEIRLCLPRANDPVKRFGETANVVVVQIGRWLVQGDELH